MKVISKLYIIKELTLLSRLMCGSTIVTILRPWADRFFCISMGLGKRALSHCTIIYSVKNNEYLLYIAY